MVAPNGARRGKADHPAIPLTDAEIVATAIACREAGADGLHLHVRDAQGRHLLDAHSYRRILDRLGAAVPGMYLQVTSEAAGRYAGPEQRRMVRDLVPAHVSVALREMVPSPAAWPDAADFYRWAADHGVAVQHIVYAPAELDALLRAVGEGRIPGARHLLQFVSGAYDDGAPGDPDDAARFVARLRAAPTGHAFDWMLCAFGRRETACLEQAARLGGKVRVGFENALWNADGGLARDNAERVREVAAALAASGCGPDRL